MEVVISPIEKVLTNNEFLACKQFLGTRAYSAGYHYCKKCGEIEEGKPSGAWRTAEDFTQRPSEIADLMGQLVKERNVDWLDIRMSSGERKEYALFAAKGSEVFLGAQWGEKTPHTLEEIMLGAKAKEEIKNYEQKKLLFSALCVLGGGILSVSLLGRFVAKPYSFLLLVLSVSIPAGVCMGLYELAKSKLRKKYSFMFQKG